MDSKKSGLVSPAQMGDKGTKGGSSESASASSGKLVSPSKATNASEANGHKNGK